MLVKQEKHFCVLGKTFQCNSSLKPSQISSNLSCHLTRISPNSILSWAQMWSERHGAAWRSDMMEFGAPSFTALPLSRLGVSVAASVFIHRTCFGLGHKSAEGFVSQQDTDRWLRLMTLAEKRCEVFMWNHQRGKSKLLVRCRYFTSWESKPYKWK